MESIESFKVDHRKIEVGLYISRKDYDIVTYDLRFKKPNTDDLLDNATIHSIEHMFATLARNSNFKDSIIYFGPMGCQTGFYLLVKSMSDIDVIGLVKETLVNIVNYHGEMVGKSEIECGNYKNLDLALAKAECGRYYDAIINCGISDLKYR
ncbi:MAG: S-ribosylhomocysteine lyase [Oscillospiraceae bacterium]|nr:S-ribosylhomocysteine lyase [Oscillospiraceae bacterium]